MSAEAGPMAGQYVSRGDKLFRAGDEDRPEYEFPPGKQREMEGNLLSNIGDKKALQIFYDKYRYIPLEYANAVRIRGDMNLKEYVESHMSREPTHDMQPESADSDRGGRLSDAEALTSGGNLEQPEESVEEIVVNAEHRQPTPRTQQQMPRIDPASAAKMKEQGMGTGTSTPPDYRDFPFLRWMYEGY
jgi:hypothetical protein